MKDVIRGEDYVELKASDLAQMNSVAISKYIDRLEQMYYDKKTVAMYYYSQAYNDERSQEGVKYDSNGSTTSSRNT